MQALARYAARATFDDLSAKSRKELPVHILDCLGCSISALGAGPVNACRDQVRDFGGGHGVTLIGGGEANPVYAAFWHTVLVRYVDFMDNFLAPTETCHTADNFGVALTAAELAGASGRELMLGVALGYTVQSRLVDHGNFMTRGFDHTAQLAFSHNAAAGRLLGMTEAEIANAIAMAASSDAWFAVIRASRLSQWKGIAWAGSTIGAIDALFLTQQQGRRATCAWSRDPSESTICSTGASTSTGTPRVTKASSGARSRGSPTRRSTRSRRSIA